MSKMSAMFPPVTVRERGRRKINKSEVGKRKTVRDLRRDNKSDMREV